MTTWTTRVGLPMVALAVATGCLAACSPADVDIELPQQNESQWVMPLDQYSLKSDDVVRGEYAANLLEKPCMESAGYAYDVPWRDLDNIQRDTWNSVHRRLFDEEIAGRWGYHLATSPETTFDDYLEFGESLADLSGDKQAALDGCIANAREHLPLVQTEANLVSAIVNVSYEDSLDDPEVTDAAKSWRECMLPFGLVDLPESPVFMPSPSLSVDANDGSASADEIALAVEDAKCRESSGYTTALYKAEWGHQVELVGKNIDVLERIGTLLDENAAQVSSVIASNSVAHSG